MKIYIKNVKKLYVNNIMRNNNNDRIIINIDNIENLFISDDQDIIIPTDLKKNEEPEKINNVNIPYIDVEKLCQSCKSLNDIESFIKFPNTFKNLMIFTKLCQKCKKKFDDKFVEPINLSDNILDKQFVTDQDDLSSISIDQQADVSHHGLVVGYNKFKSLEIKDN